MSTVNRRKILIVEDEGESQKIFRRMLGDNDFSFCVSEKILMKNLAKDKFDLITMDIGLASSKDGLKLVRELKAYSKLDPAHI